MRILTFVKHVPSSAVTPRIAESGRHIEEHGLSHEVSEAPIFKVAHYGVVGNLNEIVPELTREVRAVKAGKS